MFLRVVVHVVLTITTTVFAQSSHYLFGPSFGIRKYPGNNAIITSFETTLIPGPPTSPAQRRLAIWPGLDTSNGDLIQPIIVSSNEPQYTRRQINGAQAPLDGKDALRMKIKYNVETKMYDQTLWINGKVVSTLSTASGKANGFYMQTECQGSHKGVVSAHSYYNTTIVLEVPEPMWGSRPTRIIKSSADPATTSDMGKTWFWQEIRLKQSLSPNEYIPNQ
ncbi:hypothetical protein EG328_002777 [Venturia inaequalis]|uniref:Uncharacterized protein n=1 Tax=Venturia inaequalis TaxID=5025 RepID=A0A8H3VFA9_VENIN|nr:hypothetical protein EG328_002777 [Venturia inaequalis]